MFRVAHKRKNKLVLLGDSIIDNDPYVGLAGVSVTRHLKKLLRDWSIEKRALDGARCLDVLTRQLLAPIPPASRVVLSVGGNDALSHIEHLESKQLMTFADAMIVLRQIRETFRRQFAEVLDVLARYECKILVFTIYNPRFQAGGFPSSFQHAAEGALSAFTDAMQSEAIQHHFDVIDLRTICTDDADFANAIEPSETGGRRIAEAIAGWTQNRCRATG